MFWKIIAKIVSRPTIARYLIERAKKTPYADIMDKTNGGLYMARNWLFNPYEPDTYVRKWKWLPSIRVHHICLPDTGRHEHDHPWDARTIILDGWYVEERYTAGHKPRVLRTGDTSPIRAGDFHNISRISEGGVFTLFFTWEFMEDWGFWVNGKKIDRRNYK